MTNREGDCSDASLSLLLESDERSSAFRGAARHVESCPACQRRLTELSGSADDWASQREMLRPLDGDIAETGVLHRHRSMEPAQLRKSADEACVRELLAPPSHPEMLGRLGRYEIEEIIGAGGMGIVLKAFDTELNRPIAIKLLAPHLARLGAARQRFAREARAAAAVVHEHIVPIHNVESEHATPFLVMQYVPGKSLQARVEKEGPLSVAEILRIGLQAASGLAAAHAHGLVHRDVKPANILLENGVERVFLTDFGLARASDDASLTQTGFVSGTPHYMSPEQADGQPLDHRSDLFSLGSVLYFMATGHPPFRAERPLAVLKRTCHDPHRPAWQCNSEIPDALSRIIDRLLEKNPARRFASAGELQQELERVLADVQRGRLGRRRRWATSSRAKLLGAIVCAAIVLALAFAGWKMIDPGSGARPGSDASPESTADAPPAPVSPLDELRKIDVSPTLEAHFELDTLSRRIESLEATPFPQIRTEE